MNSMTSAQAYSANMASREELGGWRETVSLVPLMLLLFATVFSPHKPLNSGNFLAVSTAEWYRTYLFGGVYLLAGVVVLAQPARAMGQAARHGLYLVFLLYVVWSANWSAHPGKVLVMWGHFVGAYLACLAAVLSPAPRWKSLLRAFAAFATLSVAATVLIVAVNPARGIMDVGGKMRWIGFTNSANTLGVLMLVAIWSCWAALYEFRSRWWRAAILLMMPLIAFCLYKSDSMTSLLLALLISLLFPVLMRIGRMAPLWVLAVLVACGVVTASGLLVLYVCAPELFTPATVLDNLNYIGRSATFTGRTSLWETAFRAISDRPFVGWSFDALFSMSDRYAVRASHLHNGYLELLVSGGLLGGAFVAAMIAQILARLLPVLRSNSWEGVSLGILLLLLLLHNLAEPSLAKVPTLLWVVFTLLFTFLAMPRGSARQERAAGGGGEG